ncbi:hypothetical protein [Mesobacillus harenae]|uniref:hypothetical protein n=1 Tax=Mesobacillus harenae TaxID=2213203 RepID=UPI0015805A4B|nr:hypothetical protein [Mesobacillus harenae]
MDYSYLLSQYKMIWNNRQLSSILDDETVLKEAVERELKDENSHPRIRKNLFEKYYLATSRILESRVENKAKLLLIELHADILKELRKE